MTVLEQDIRDVTESVWSNMLNATAEPRSFSTGALRGPIWTGSVRMTGAWEGAVTIHCSHDLARAAAVALFALDSCEPSEEEVRDALGELANVVGGNIKALLPGPTDLSLPRVDTSERSPVTLDGEGPGCTVWFASHGETFAVTLRPASAPSRRPTGDTDVN
jgi:chemotaxis protein CheX